MPQLHDELGQVGLPGGDARGLEGLVHLDLLGGHGLDLDHLRGDLTPLGVHLGRLVAQGVAHQADDDPVGLLGVARPVDGRAGAGEGLLELQQVVVEVPQGAVLDLLAGHPHLLPVGALGDDAGALVADGGHRVVEVLALHGVRELSARRGREGR